MKKRILSILLALVMLVGMFPVQAFASERSYVYVSFEVCDADGSGRTLIKPERNERVQYKNDYALAAMRQAIGSNSDVKYDSDHLCITGVKDASQSDGFLDNGDIEGYRWIVLRNNAEWDGTDYNTMYKLGDNEVLRCIYTDKSVEEMSAVNKDAFVRYLSEVGENMWYESSAGYAEYMAALDVLVNSTATSADVQNATNALVAALTVSATVVEINQGEEMELGVHKSATLKATVTPSNTTDTMVWSSVDDSIVSVNATTGEITGVAEGETNVTVTVGAVSDTIKIIVKPIAATAVSIKNGEAISLEARASVQLEAELTPAGATDTVSWCVADQSIATVDENGLLTGKTVGQTTVTATAGNVSDTIKVTVTETTVPYVYFEYADGRIQELENDTFTLTALDEGSFKVGNFSSKLTWKCSDSITNNYNETEWRYWINTEGKYQPHGIKKIAATVTGNGFSKTFYINEVSSGISEIKVSVNGTEVDAQNPYSVTGMTTSVISVQGLKDGQWIYIPTQAWMAESGNTNVARILGNQMEIIDEGQSDVTVAMVDNEEAATSFSVVCNQVPVTGIEVHVPASFVIEKWDSMDGGYVGIIFGYEKPASEYYITFTPSNATNRNVIWTNLTPEIAEFHELHGAGIVPKKAGTAKFRVTSESNPDVYQDVEIVFSFKTPLTNAVIAEKSYALEEGQTVDLDITVTPDNATEPRFIWTYSKEGIVKVTETVSADTYTRTVTRRLNCLRTGSVTVTGTPIDDSANCPPIQFTVVVGDASGEDTTDYLQIAKNDIAHGKAYLSGQNQTYFNNEWTIFTYLRTGGTMDAQKKIAYLQNVQDEIANYGDSLETLDYTRLILTLPLLGENPANFADEYDLVEALCNSFSDNQTSNMYAYGLLTLDSMAYEMPADSAWSRDALIEKILTFQASDGSFGLGNNSSGSVDMTAIVLQALAPYNNANHPAVQTAITKALSYLKENLSANAGFEAEGGENACSSAQVLIALTALGIDPSDKDSGFTIGKSNLITNLDGFKLESGGFYWLEGNETVNLMGTQQITYAMEAYRRFVLDLNPLYDLTDLNESGSSTFTVTLPEGEGFDAKICDGFASTVAKGGDFSFYIVIESGYERSNMVVKAGNTILTADSYGVYTIKNIKSDVQITVSGVQKLDYTNLLSAAIGADALDVAYIGLKTYKTGNGTEYQNIPFYTVKLPVESALTLTYNSTNPRAMLWMNYYNRFKENSGTYTFSSELLAGMYAMSSEKFVEAFGSDTGLNTTHTVAFIEVTTMGYNRLCCVLVELVPAESEEPEIPLAITVNGEAVEVTSLGEREYLSSSWKDPYTKPIYTVKIPAGADFVIGQTADGDGASGAVRIFTRADGMSIDGQYPYTVTVSDLKTFFKLSTEEFQERVGSDTGLDTAKNLAFIEVKDSGYERLYVLLVEFEVAAEPDEPGDDEKPDVTIPITAELHDGTALTVTVNGTQSVNGNDVPVLEIAIPEGTSYVKVIPSGDYRVYDCDGYWDENADNLSVVPSWGDFYTLTADGGRTIDYVIKFVEAKEEEKPEATLPITAELHDGTALTVTVNGTQSVNGNDVPVLEIAIPEGTSYVKVIPSGSYQVYDCDGWFDENADNLSVVPSWGDFYTLTADGGRTIDYVIKFVEAKEDAPVVTVPIDVSVNGEVVEVTSIGDRTYSNAFGWGPYTLPFFTVKVLADTEFTITAEGAVNFACYDGYSLDGSSPFTVPVDSIQNIGGSGIGFGMSAEKFVELFGSDTGLNTENKLAFIEIKDDNYDRMYGLLVELEGSVEPEEPENPEDPDITIPIIAELLDGTALTVTVNGTQSVNGIDVPVLEIAIPEGTSYVKVIPSGSYQVYDCDGWFDENADNLSVVPSWGDFYTLTADGGRTIDYVIKFVEVKEDAPVVTVPIDVSVNGEAVEVTSIGDRTYSNAFGWGPYTLPFFTVKVPADTEFTITAEGAVNFACYDGYSLDGSSPFTVPVDSIQNIGGSGVGFGMSAEKFVELFGSDTGLNTENKLAFIEIKDDNYDRMYGLLVELEGSVEPEEPENPEDPDITIPITAELLDGTALTVTVNGTQSVNGNDVPVLEIAIPVGTTHVKVIPSGDYRVYDCDGYWDENADNLAVSPSWGDFYTLTADGGRTIDYVIKFAEAKEEPPVVTVPITVTVNGEAVEVTSLGEREYLSSSWKDPYTKPIYTVKIQEGADFVINQSSTGDGASGVSRTFAKANGESYSGDYPYTMRANYLNQYLLSAEEFVERVGNDTGLDITQKLAFIEVKDSFYERIYVLLVELIPAEPEPVKYQVNLTEGAGFTLRAAAGSASPVEPGSSFSFTISINESFEKTTDFAVKANGVKLEEVDGKYTISNIQDDQTVTVEGVVGKATTDTLTVTANGERCNVVNTGLTTYKQSIYGTITDVPVYKTSVPADTDFIVNWRLDKDGDDYSSTYRYAFSIDAGGDQGAKYYPFTMRTSVFGDYMLSAAQVKEFFGLDISSANALFMEVYGSEHSEGDFNPLYGLLVELVVPKTTYTVNFALLGDHKHAETEAEIHTLIDNNLEVWVAAKDYEVEPGATILDVLNMVAAENNLTVGNPNGDYVKYITKDGVRLSEFTNGARSGWMYTINGNHSGLGVAEQKLADGDVIIFHYTDDYTREKSSPADLEAAAAVVAKINAIGTVSLESKAKIEEARAAYDALSDEQRDLIGADVLKKLTDAEETYVELEKNAADKAAAEAVEDKISAIGTVTMDSKAAIDEARAAYEELSDTQKNLVSNYQLLSQAEAAYAELVKTAADEAAAEAVADKIDAIGTVTLDSESKIKEARKAYDALTDVQKALVTNREKLFAAEKKLVELKDQDAADAVEAKIAAIGTVTLNSEAKIKAAREAYNALTDTQKALVENLAILEAAEEALELLNLAGTDITNIYKTTGDYLAGLSAPVVGSTNGEWRVIGLTRAGKTVADSYYDAVVEYVKNNIDANGRLDESKSTENARVILALTAIGKDVTNVGGYNLLKGLDDMSYIRKQGINGLLWTLIAFDSHDYEIPAGDVTREKLVQAILNAQVAGGGWALNGNVGDPDMTGMALQALSPYYGKNTAVTAAVDKALTWLSGIQNENGSFSGAEGTTCESLAQVITGLTALGLNPETDSRFIKNGVSAVDALSQFYVQGGGFKHGLTGDRNMMATEQGYYALVSYYRLLQGKSALYDMSDVTIQTAAKDQEAADAVEALISAIGTVTKDSGEKIRAARNAYDALTDAQKALVENYKILTAAETKYAELVKTAEDEAAAKALEEKIDAIGTVTLDSESKIKEARKAYDALTDVQKVLVKNYKTLTDAEAKYADLVKAVEDESAANAVEALISAIGTVTKDSGDKIKAARDAYDVLTENQKKLVENYKTLTDAESKFADLNSTISVTFTLLGCSKHGTDQVHTLADGNLSTWIAKKTYMVAPGATVKDVLQMALTAAGMNYKNPTGNYVESINGIGEFTNGSNSGWMYTLNGVHSSLGIAEQTVKEGDVIVFHYTDDYTKEKGGTATDEDTAIENVEALINAIGTVTLNSKSKIDAARKAYDALSFTQKQKVENYKKLTDAETKYAQLKADDDDKKANTIANLIDAIISGSSTFEKDVKAAQKAYNNLTADQKKLVDNYYKLANYLKDLADEEDKEAAKTVEALIDAIGAVTKDSEDEIKSARTAYDKLTDTQKALLSNYAELEDAEARWEDLQALVDVENIYKDTGAYLKRLGTPAPGSVGGEWMAIGLIRSGNEIKDPAAYYDAIVKFIQENIDENGRLHKAKSTENSRMILALTALGKDATAVGGYNLLAGLNDMEYVQKQGINGPIWALIALDSGNYPAPEGDVSREALIQVILDAQLADGGWALTGSISDADITGMVLQALARYYKTNADVTEAVDKAIAALSMMQAADGSFASVDGDSSESVAQVIAALSALGIDADTDARFIKNGVSALDALCAFFVEDGGFKHIHDGKLDGMATEQSYYALAAYFRMLEGKSALFDMTDVVDMGGDVTAEEPVETLPVETEPAPTEPVEVPTEGGRSFPWRLVIVIGVLAGAIVVLVIISKPKKGRHMK